MFIHFYIYKYIFMDFRALLSIILFFSVTNLHAQQKGIFSFNEEIFDFGTIKENDGPVEHKFVFTNSGDAPLIIQGVRASCGCTTPAWTKEPVPPGEKGFVLAKFNPKNRPGSFKKSLTITSNASQSAKTIFIAGMVQTAFHTEADNYRTKIGNLRLRYQAMNMGKVTTEKLFTRSFDVYNDSDEPIAFLDQMTLPRHIVVRVQPEVLAPKTRGKIIVTYDAKLKADLGYVSDPIRITTDEKKDAEKPLLVNATIEEYFPPMTQEELALAPKLKFDNPTFDFGSQKEGTTSHTTFKFTNVGKSMLNIRTLKSTCGCTVFKLDKKDYGPGESGEISVDFNSTGRRGSQQKSIVVFSNDPTASHQRLIIKANVTVSN